MHPSHVMNLTADVQTGRLVSLQFSVPEFAKNASCILQYDYLAGLFQFSGSDTLSGEVSISKLFCVPSESGYRFQ